MNEENRLPKGLHIHRGKNGDRYHVRIKTKNKEFRRSLGRIEQNQAILALKQIRAQIEAEKRGVRFLNLSILAGRHAGHQFPEIGTTISIMLAKAKARAISKGYDFNLTESEIADLLNSTNGRCQVTNTPFVFDKNTEFRANPFQPSLDRIDSSQGYVKGNIRIVCYGVNIALGQWGESVFSIFAKNYVFTQLAKLENVPPTCQKGQSKILSL